MSRLVRRPTSLFGLAVVLVALPLWWAFRPRPAPTATQNPAPAAAVDVGGALLRAGLDARVLAASGVAANSVAGLVTAANAHVALNPNALAIADAAYASAKRESDRLKRLIESGHGSAEDVASYQAHSAALASATVQRDTALNALATSATANLTNAQRGTLAQIRANQSWKEVALEFLVLERTQSQWVALRDALAAERIAAAAGDALGEVTITLLATARANEAVAAAKASLETNSMAVASAWNAATHD